MPPDPPAQRHDPTELSDRAALRTVRERRGRIIRTVLKVAGVVVAMALLLILNRDNQSARGCRTRMEALAERLQVLERSDDDNDNPVQLLLRDPHRMPDESQDVRSQLGHVHINTFYHVLAASRGQAGVCYCRESHERILLPSGRNVLLFDAADKSYKVVWMEETEFRAQAEGLGFRTVSREEAAGE